MMGMYQKLQNLGHKARSKSEYMVIVTDNAGYAAYWNSLEPQQRFMNKMLADWGFQNIMFMNTPIVFMNNAKPGYHLAPWPENPRRSVEKQEVAS